MFISYSVSESESLDLPIDKVNVQDLFEESMIALWSKFGNGQLHIFDNDKVSLGIERLDTNSFFLDWHYEGRMVVYNGEKCDEYFTTDCGGDDFYIPKACTVDKKTAIKAVLFAIKEKAKYPNVHWTLMSEVPFAKGWYAN